MASAQNRKRQLGLSQEAVNSKEPYSNLDMQEIEDRDWETIWRSWQVQGLYSGTLSRKVWTQKDAGDLSQW